MTDCKKCLGCTSQESIGFREQRFCNNYIEDAQQGKCLSCGKETSGDAYCIECIISK